MGNWASIGLAIALGLFAVGCNREVPSQVVPSHEGAVSDTDTAKLKVKFEAAWLPHVNGYTNYTTAGMADDASDMAAFIKEWKPIVIRNQVYRESDKRLQEKMVDRMIKADSIAALYYGMLIPHDEMMARWKAHDSIKNATCVIDGYEVKFTDGKTRWMNRDYEKYEMMGVLVPELIWAKGRKVYAVIHTDITANFEPGTGSDSLCGYWFVRFENGKISKADKLAHKDLEWLPCPNTAPYGYKYHFRFTQDKLQVINVKDGAIVQSVDL